MNTLRQILTILLLLVFLLLFSQTGSTAAPPAQKSQPGLFTEVVGVSNLDTSNDPTVIRSRPVEVDLGQLAGSATQDVDIASTPEINDVVQLNLFDDVSYTAILDEIQALPNGGYVWIGHLEGIDLSEAIFVVNAGQTAGNIAEPDAFYGIRYVGGDVHAVLQIDQSAFPGDNPIPVDLPEDPAPIQVTADDGSQIDILVAYTASTRQAAGGTTAIQNLINLAVTETNQSYANSGVNPRLQLVHTEEVVYTETGNIFTDLDRLTGTSDGYMDNLHSLRNTHNADMVSLIVENGGGYCGVAKLMTNVSSTFEDSAFSLTARSCATGYYSFGHELGHNMGARHDWYVDSTNNSPYTHNHGYSNITDRWRTMMAYNTQCSASGVNCTRLPYWSNPNVTYGGDPMGIPEGSFQAADNRKTINYSAYTVANFRDSGGTPSVIGPLVYNSHSIDDNTVNQSSGNDNGIPECGETIEMFIWLRNQGVNTATGVNVEVSTSSTYVSFIDDNSNYNDISGGFILAGLDDIDFSIAANTPSGHNIQFDLNITASNGGPWSASYLVPVTCDPNAGDSYESDDSSVQATTITSGSSQNHSIYPVSDDDWITFTLAQASGITLETSGTPGDDTRLWLYNSALSLIDFNDDINLSDGNFFSRITRTCEANMLSSGTYYARVDEYNDDDVIAGYDLEFTSTACTDTFEDDDSLAQAQWINSDTPQFHSIIPADDHDWVKFTIDYPSKVTLQTYGITGDTRLWLYDSSETEIEYDDDAGIFLFSKITRACDNPLEPDTYYVEVDEFLNNTEISGYNLLLNIQECHNVYLPVVIK